MSDCDARAVYPQTMEPARALLQAAEDLSNAALVANRRSYGDHNKQAGLNLLRGAENLLQSIELRFMLRKL